MFGGKYRSPKCCLSLVFDAKFDNREAPKSSGRDLSLPLSLSLSLSLSPSAGGRHREEERRSGGATEFADGEEKREDGSRGEGEMTKPMFFRPRRLSARLASLRYVRSA
jgi:hypothetical protein